MSMSTLEEVFMKKGHFPKAVEESFTQLSKKPQSLTNKTPELSSGEDAHEFNGNDKLK